MTAVKKENQSFHNDKNHHGFSSSDKALDVNLFQGIDSNLFQLEKKVTFFSFAVKELENIIR